MLFSQSSENFDHSSNSFDFLPQRIAPFGFLLEAAFQPLSRRRLPLLLLLILNFFIAQIVSLRLDNMIQNFSHFFRDKGHGPCEDVHERREYVGVGRVIELLDV